jgi:two-component system cell cycle sensor histidine kinase/response regulator CckA
MRRSFEQPPAGSESDDRSLPEFSRDRVAAIVELSPIAAFAADREGILTAVNDSLCDLLGHRSTDLIDSKFEKISAPPERGYEQVHLSDLPPRADMDLVRADGETVSAEIFCRRFSTGECLVFVVDLTGRQLAERDRLDSEKKRWQSDRIEALGRLAGGIAHDFNNFLAVLLLHVDILNLHLDADSPIRGRVAEIKEVANSVAVTVRQLFAFGRKQPMTLQPTKLDPVLNAFADEFRTAADGIDFELIIDPELGLCFVDPDQVVQVLRNLAANAREAMPNGGKLRIEAANIMLDAATVTAPQPPGPYIQISVADTGIGMEPSTEAHIFEPFFSTKESDKGAGLALAMVYGIVKQSKGFIWVNSEPGKGTTFRIQFPRIDLPQPVQTQQPRPETAEPDASEQKTVLLVDDEPAVRRITTEFLEMSGYKVLTAAGGMEALEVSQAYFDPIHLLLTDLSMPLMDGREVAQRVTKLHPETAVLFMSGNVNLDPSHDTATNDWTNFISKPYSLTSLIDKVQAVLENQ